MLYEVITSEIDSLYTVRKGDYLKKIARELYDDSKLWDIIWEANKDGVYNSDDLIENYKKKIKNPDRIYPGQILFIPPLKK